MRLWIALAAFVLLVGCSLDGTAKVKYRVVASESVYRVTIRAEDGGNAQFTDVSLPWAYSFKAYGGDFAYVSAGGYGTVVVEIYLDGKLYKQTQSVGSPVIATASGTVLTGW